MQNLSNFVLEKQNQAPRLMSSANVTEAFNDAIQYFNCISNYIVQHLLFMFKVERNMIFWAFNQRFSIIDCIYSTRFSDSSFTMLDVN